VVKSTLRIFVFLSLICSSYTRVIGQNATQLSSKERISFVSFDLSHAAKQGTQLNIDLPLSRRSSLHIGRSNIYTYNPEWLSNDAFFFFFFGTDIARSDLQGVISQELHLALKFGLGKKAKALNGFYWGPEFRHGRFASISWEDNQDGFPQPHIAQSSTFTQFGFNLGWQKVIRTNMYVDFDLHLLFNSFDVETDPIFFLDQFEVNPSIPIIGRAGLNIGGMVPTKKQYRSLKVNNTKKMSLTFDLNTFIRSGTRIDLHIPLKNSLALGLNGSYFNSENELLDLFVHRDLEYYRGFGVGADIRLYLPGFEVFDGPYWEASYGFQMLNSRYSWFFNTPNSFGREEKDIKDNAHSLGIALGYSKEFAEVFTIEMFLRNRLVIAKTEFRERVPYTDLSPGLKAGLGLRIGIAF